MSALPANPSIPPRHSSLPLHQGVAGNSGPAPVPVSDQVAAVAPTPGPLPVRPTEVGASAAVAAAAASVAAPLQAKVMAATTIAAPLPVRPAVSTRAPGAVAAPAPAPDTIQTRSLSPTPVSHSYTFQYRNSSFEYKTLSVAAPWLKPAVQSGVFNFGIMPGRTVDDAGPHHTPYLFSESCQANISLAGAGNCSAILRYDFASNVWSITSPGDDFRLAFTAPEVTSVPPLVVTPGVVSVTYQPA